MRCFPRKTTQALLHTAQSHHSDSSQRSTRFLAAPNATRFNSTPRLNPSSSTSVPLIEDDKNGITDVLSNAMEMKDCLGH